MATDRSAQLIACAQAFNDYHNKWANDASTPDFPPVDYWNLCDKMLQEFKVGELPGDCRLLAKAVFAVGIQYNRQMASDDITLRNEFCHARESLERMLHEALYGQPEKQVESVQELHRQEVPHEQIARMHGWTAPDGTGLSHLVAQELQRPGSVNRGDKLSEDRRTAAEQAREEYLSEYLPKSQPEPQEDAPCPESSYELWLQKVSLPQASKMLKKPPELVEMEWEEFEIQKKHDEQQQVVREIEEQRSAVDHEQQALVERAKQLGVSGVNESWKTETLRKHIAEAEAKSAP